MQNKSNFKRILSLLLCALTVAPAIVSCSESSVNDGETETAAETQANVSAEEETEEETEQLQPDIPELKFGGATFTFLTPGAADHGAEWATNDFWADSLTGEVINDSVFERNAYLNETYDIKLVDYNTESSTSNELKNEVQSATGAFQAGFTHLETYASLSQTGILLDLHELPYINTDQPWWDHRAVEELDVRGHMFWATGDITTFDNEATWVLYFNKQLREDLQLEDFYTMVREDRWLIDTFGNFVSVACSDLNGDGSMTMNDDRFGFTTTSDSSYGLFYASGERFAERDEEEIFALNDDLDSMSKVVETAGKIMADKSITLVAGPDDARINFQEGKALFYGEVMQCATRMRESDMTFGLLPWPKYDESQDRYYNWIHTSVGRGVVVPSSLASKDYEMVGAIIEAMAAKSMYTLTAAYYDKALKYKYLRDEESAEMLDLILQSRRYDIAGIYGLGINSNIIGLIANGNTDVVSRYEKNIKATTKMLNKIVGNYDKLG